MKVNSRPGKIKFKNELKKKKLKIENEILILFVELLSVKI